MKQNKKVVGTPNRAVNRRTNHLNRKLAKSITVNRQLSITKGKERNEEDGTSNLRRI